MRWVLLVWVLGAQEPEVVRYHTTLERCENHKAFVRQYAQSEVKRYACAASI